MRQLCLRYVFDAPVEGEEAAVGAVAVESPQGSGPTAFPPWPLTSETTGRETGFPVGATVILPLIPWVPPILSSKRPGPPSSVGAQVGLQHIMTPHH